MTSSPNSSGILSRDSVTATRCTAPEFSAPMTLNSPPSLPSRASWICCGDARPFADKRLSWPSFSSRVMRASSESRLWAAIGVASKTAKSRLLQMRNMEQVSGAREMGSRSYGAIRHSEGLALSPTPWASFGQLAHLPGDRSMQRHRFLLLVCITLLSFPRSVNAQTTTGTVRGFVKDQSGVGVADVEVSARNLESGAARSTATRSDGSYVLPGLGPAQYDIVARKIGFTPQTRRVQVQVGATLDLDLALQAGAVELQAVSVEANAVETRTSEVATNVTQHQVENLPTVDRNFLNLAALAPGVAIQNPKLNDTRRTFSA